MHQSNITSGQCVDYGDYNVSKYLLLGNVLIMETLMSQSNVLIMETLVSQSRITAGQCVDYGDSNVSK